MRDPLGGPSACEMMATRLRRLARAALGTVALVLLRCGEPFRPGDFVGMWSGSGADYSNVRLQVTRNVDTLKAQLTFDVPSTGVHLDVTPTLMSAGHSLSAFANFLPCAAPYENLTAVGHPVGLNTIRFQITLNIFGCICTQLCNPGISSSVLLHRT